MNCRLCLPNVVSGIFTLFGASADGRGISLLIITGLFELTTTSMKRKNIHRIGKESGKLHAVFLSKQIANKGKIFFGIRKLQ
jgi:hypothetical protein